MQYRTLSRTGLNVSLLGLVSDLLGQSLLVQRVLEVFGPVRRNVQPARTAQQVS
ncbi:MAG: hypothetical protein M3069_15560 [Chloroflexota bacterium]|nr:hypothetical protein [Chloroflexota bacterium]